MSLYVGVVRIGLALPAGDQPLLDVLFDTTQGDRELGAFCHVAYHPDMLELAMWQEGRSGVHFGHAVNAVA